METFSFRDRPCSTCPYRRDVPSGVWDESEYLKLVEYDRETFDQLGLGLFLCHDGDRDTVLCRGWLETHGDQPLSIRLAMTAGKLTELPQTPCDVPCFASGQEAHDHGMRDYENLSVAAARRQQYLMERHPELESNDG